MCSTTQKSRALVLPIQEYNCRGHTFLYLSLPLFASALFRTSSLASFVFFPRRERLMERADMGYQQRYKARDFDFAQRLVTLRKHTGLTQGEIALRVGVTEKAIRNWEGGSNYPSEPNLQKLIEVYLGKNAFTSGHEQDEARLLGELLHENSSHRIGSFDEHCIMALLN